MPASASRRHHPDLAGTRPIKIIPIHKPRGLDPVRELQHVEEERWETQADRCTSLGDS